MRIFGTRMSLIGDIIMSLPVLQKLCEIVDEPYVIFSIAQKCKQSAPLFYNHPLINEIKISDHYEDIGEEDQKIIDTCDIVLPVRPPPPKQHDWYNHRDLISETTRMAGFNEKFTANVYPVLYINREVTQALPKTLAIWPFAGYGQGLSRSPSVEWWNVCISKLISCGFNILHCGAESEPVLSEHEKYSKVTTMAFVDQIYMSLGCCGCIGTDSGSMWVIAAYNKVPQINLMTNWLPNHVNNKLALAPVGPKTHNLYADGSCSNINTDSVVIASNEIFCT